MTLPVAGGLLDLESLWELRRDGYCASLYFPTLLLSRYQFNPSCLLGHRSAIHTTPKNWMRGLATQHIWMKPQNHGAKAVDRPNDCEANSGRHRSQLAETF